MNKAAWMNYLQKHSLWVSQGVISLIFIALIGVFVGSLNHYWKNTLEPRLYKAAETQAKVLAQSQSTSLVETLTYTKTADLHQALKDKVQEMLIVEDPSIGERFIRRLRLQIDYSSVPVEENSLDMDEGDRECVNCFQAEIPLISRRGDILGLADFAISDGYFSALSAEMKSKLFAESGITLGLLSAVWVVMLVMFYRLHAAKQIVEASDQAKTRFMANVTHELRTPLNAILGYTQLYKRDAELMKQYGQGINTIDRSAEHLLLMINDILEFSRANEENLILYPTEINLANFLNTLVEMSLVRARLKNLSFKYEADENLPVAIMVDDKRLRQVLLNLLSNAVKFTEQGEVLFRVNLMKPPHHDMARIRFTVKDSGIGIPRDQLKTIFIPFQQLDNDITRAEGSGLGLTISQRLVKLMGSRLKVGSSPGEGSEFSFDLDLTVLSGSSMDISPAQKTESAAFVQPRLHLPDAAVLDELKEQSRRHNILGIRELVEALDQDGRYEVFLDQVRPFIQHYRFKPLLEWLEQLETRDR